MVSISTCHAEDPGPIPGGGVLLAPPNPLADKDESRGRKKQNGVCDASHLCLRRGGGVLQGMGAKLGF